MSKTPRPLNAVELSILRDFDRAPVRRRGECSDGQGRVLRYLRRVGDDHGDCLSGRKVAA